jgi:hypothetical protein
VDDREGAGDPEFIKRQDQKRSDLDEQLREYITEWRKQRAKEEDELKKLKEKQAKRKVTRADEERKMAERKKQEEERRVREIEEKKQRDIEEKRQRLEEAEKKRQAMMQALKDQNKNKGPNFTITKRDAAVSWGVATENEIVRVDYSRTSVRLRWKGTRPKSSWKRRRRSLCPFASSLWCSTDSAWTSCAIRLTSCGSASSNWKQRNMT